MSAISIFKIKKEERWLSIAGFLYFISLNALMIYKYYNLFTPARKGGFWSLFWNNFHVSGFDCYTYIILSKWDSYYVIARHPLLACLLWPFSQLNKWLMVHTGTNFAVFIVAFFLLFFAFYSLLFIYRIFREVVQLSKIDSWLLSWLFFSFAYIMLTVMVPDHFCCSLFLLTMVLYISGMKMNNGSQLKAGQAALFFFITAGVTLTNGVKVWIAQSFANGKHFFRWRNLLTVVVVPSLLLGAVIIGEQETFGKKLEQRSSKMDADKLQKDSTFRHNVAIWNNRKKEMNEGKVEGKGILKWMDVTTPRIQSITENLWGESLLLHEDHLLEDIHRTRPMFVYYQSPISYAILVLIALLFILGILAGCHERFLWLCLSLFAFDLLMHVGFGFGLNEVYIMAAHWTFVIPIAIGYIFKRLNSIWYKWTLRGIVPFLTLYLLYINTKLISTYMT